MIKELSIVCPNNTAGLPIAYGVAEALRAHQMYWAEDEIRAHALSPISGADTR